MINANMFDTEVRDRNSNEAFLRGPKMGVAQKYNVGEGR